MHIAILSDGPGLSAYTAELLKTWGLPLARTILPDAVSDLDPSRTPVLILPALRGGSWGAGVLTFARRGGTVFAFLPDSEISKAAGLVPGAQLVGPLRLRVTRDPAPGLDGELLPVVGPSADYETSDGVHVLA
jgi:hypothetical protein